MGAGKHSSKTKRLLATRTWFDQAALRTELAICVSELRTDQAVAVGSSSGDPQRTDGKRVVQQLDSRSEQPLDLRVEHYAIPLLRSRICRYFKRGAIADNTSGTTAVI